MFGAHLDDTERFTVFYIYRYPWPRSRAIRLPPNEKDLPQAFKDRLAKNPRHAAQPGDYIVFEWSAEGATVGMAVSARVQAGRVVRGQQARLHRHGARPLRRVRDDLSAPSNSLRFSVLFPSLLPSRDGACVLVCLSLPPFPF